MQKVDKKLIVHRIRITDGELAEGAKVLAKVDPEWRLGARQAHSGTHVLHAALRQVLGPEALQSGSYNKPGYLRLDFAWNQALSAATRSELEEVVEPRRPAGPAGPGALRLAGRGAGDGRDRAVRRDLRRHRADRRDRRAVVGRAVRRHPCRALLADRPARDHRASPRSVPACAGWRPPSASRRSTGSPPSAPWSPSWPGRSRCSPASCPAGSRRCWSGCERRRRNWPVCGRRRCRRRRPRWPQGAVTIGDIALVAATAPEGTAGR